VVNVAGHRILAIKHNALHCVEDFLMARFAWYSQVIRSARGAKFDAIAEKITFYLLEKGLIYRYSDLLEMVANDPHRFYGFNDTYFMSLVHKLYIDGVFDKNLKIKDMAECILFERSPRTIRCEEFKQRVLDQDDQVGFEKIQKKANDKLEQIIEVLARKGTKLDWVISDLPKKHIHFVKSKRKVVKEKNFENVLLERDPAKILMDNGEVRLLAEVENSVIYKLQNTFNYVPNVFCSDSAYKILVDEGIIAG
jgi:hypothetical protein